MDDRQLHETISGLVEEEQRLRRQHHSGERLTDDERERLAVLEVHLDQLWDLLRRRQAREEFGQDPDAEHERPASVVERYQQ